MMKFIRTYSMAIMGVLFFLLCCKSCQSCSRGNQLEYNQVQYERVVDSLVNEHKMVQYQLRDAQDSIKVLNTTLNALRDQNGLIKESLDEARSNSAHLRDANKKLTNNINR